MLRTWVIALSILFAVSSCKKKGAEPAPDPAATSSTATPAPHAPPGAGAPAQRPQIPAPADVAKAPDDAQKTKLGVAYKVLQPGKAGGAKAGQNDLVTIHFTVWSTKGETKHSTTFRNKPDSFPLGAIPMRELADGVTGMTVGEKRRLWAPADLAYKPPSGEVEPLTYEVELVETKEIVKTPTDLAPPANAETGPANTKYQVLTKGKSKTKPNDNDQIKMVLSEWSPDGRLRRSSLLRGEEPTQAPVKSLPPGLHENVLAMTIGEKRHIWAPGGADQPDSARLYEIEVVDTFTPPPPPEAPKDVAKPPADAKKTPGGVFYTVLKPGSGKEKPTASNDVTVHYSGWTTDGKMFDSSVTRGQPASFNLSRVIPGWTDGLQTMVTGQKNRFWIPEEMAYKGRQGPQGMLVFDVELIAIKNSDPK